MMFHGLIETRSINTGSGRKFQQRRFYCHVHGWFDLFVFPDAEREHAVCSQTEKSHGAGLELPRAMGKAA